MAKEIPAKKTHGEELLQMTKDVIAAAKEIETQLQLPQGKALDAAVILCGHCCCEMK